MNTASKVHCHIGCSGWSVPKELRTNLKGSCLEQYAQVLNSVEINSSFYRHHKHKTYARWSETVPEDFCFSVKLPKAITHSSNPFADTLERFFEETDGLGKKFETVLLQFPPKKDFDEGPIADLLKSIRKVFHRKVVCEPRHASWFETKAINVLRDFTVSLVIADPKVVPNAPDIFGTRHDAYFRLHGTPRIYFSDYPQQFLMELKNLVAQQSAETWVIFDNTALGHGFRNAKTIIELLQAEI